jgi:hypothetical protein
MRLQTLIRTALFAFLCICAQPLFAAIGTIDSLEGDVHVVSATADRAAKAGMEVNEGDTVKTGANAWALLVMSDGASMTLRQQSQLRLDTYHYDSDGEAAKNSSALSLLKGAFRSITGYIGRTNRDGYRINTPTATIGIRGTDHEPAYYPPPGPGEKLDHEPGTYDKVNDGESFIRNPKGEIAVRRGQFAFVHHDRNFAPRLLTRLPAFYQRHAEFDRRAAKRRQEFHRNFEERHQRRLQERRGAIEPRKEAVRQQRELNEKKQGERGEQQRREMIEKRQQERQAAQDHKKQERSEEIKKRREERAHKKDWKKDHDQEKY